MATEDTLIDAIHALDNENMIAKIERIAAENNCIFKICFPKDSRLIHEVHLLADALDLHKPVSNLYEMIGVICGDLGYEKIVGWPGKSFDQTKRDNNYIAITPLTLHNYQQGDLKNFFQTHYAQFTHQDKKQRSVSSPPRGSSFFPQNSSDQKEEVKLPTPEMVVEHLQQASWWADLKRTSPERAEAVIDQACGRAKRALSEEQTVSTRPTGAAK